MNETPETERLVFVVHKHRATTLHYDFRLEIGGVMPSWAIPKGPTLDPQLKRLAMPTTDHTLDYRHFEGVLEEGQEGAGPVMVWDEGTYIPEREIGKGVLEAVNERTEAEVVMQQGLAAGQLKFRLHGHKLRLFRVGPDFQGPHDDLGGGGPRCPSCGDSGYGQCAEFSRPAGPGAAAPGIGGRGFIVVSNSLIVVGCCQAEDGHRVLATCYHPTNERGK